MSVLGEHLHNGYSESPSNIVLLNSGGIEETAQLFSTNAFSANTFSINVLPSFTAIYSQSIVNTNNFFTYFYQRKQISRKLHWIY